MTTKVQTLLSVLISFSFYFIWTWYANSLVSDNFTLLLRTAFIQGTYSAFMTLTFTSLLTWTLSKMKCHKHPFIAIVPPLIVQSSTVFLINYLNGTPNLMLTILPSIFFTAVYGIVFTFSLLKKPEFDCNEKS